MTGRRKIQCVVIVTESVLEAKLLRTLEQAGSRGWTISTARGRGPNDSRISDIDGGQIRVETLVSEEVAERIWGLLEGMYFHDYAMAAWSYDVAVHRVERYTR